MTITWTFAPGQIIFSSRFNTNFSDVKAWADAHELLNSNIHGITGNFVDTGTPGQIITVTKTFTLPKIRGAGVGVVTLQNANTALNLTITIPDSLINADFVLTEGTQNINGIKRFAALAAVIRGAGAGAVSLQYENTAANRTHTIPAKAANDTFAMISDIGPGATFNNPNITGTVTGGATYNNITLVQPTIGDFTNAQHDHSNAANGGSALNSPTITSPAINTSMDMSAGNVTVALNNSTNALNFNSNHVVFDGTNKKIGIGTTTLISVSFGGLKTLGDIASSGTTTAPQTAALGYLNAYNGVHMIGGGDAAGGQFVNSGSYNVTSFTRNAAGDYTILMTTQTLNSLSKAFTGLLNASIASNKHGSQIISTTTTTVQVSTLDDGGLALDADYTVGLIGAT